jgi:hypothetical protein
MTSRRVVKVERLRGREDQGRETLCYFVRPGSRSRSWVWLELWQVPEFEGESAMFEIERVKGAWIVLRGLKVADES